jgi:hypothetical protein
MFVACAGDSYILVDLKRVPNMGVKDFSALNYTQKKQYNVKGLHMQMESYIPGIGVSLLFNRSLIVSFAPQDVFIPNTEIMIGFKGLCKLFM